MSAFVPPRDNAAPARLSGVDSIGRCSSIDSGSLTASSASSLAMIREAFRGLLVDTEMSPSSATGQRDELERSNQVAPQGMSEPTAFVEGTYSFSSVSETEFGLENSTSFGLSDVNTASKKFSCTESTEFFNYLLAIGGAQ